MNTTSLLFSLKRTMNNIVTYIFPAIILLVACCRNHNTSNNAEKIYDSINISTSKEEKLFSNKTVICAGKVCIPNNYLTLVSVPIKSFVQNILVTEGHYVRQGSSLAVLEPSCLITLQTEYHTAKSQYEYYKQDYKRQGELGLEQAATIKKMQHSKMEYQKYEAKYYALKARLRKLGIKPEILMPDSLITHIILNCPANGIVKTIHARKGKFYNEENVLFEIIDPVHSIIECYIPVKYINSIQTNDTVSFSYYSDSLHKHYCTVNSISQFVNADNTVTVTCMPQFPNNLTINDMPVYAYIKKD